MKKRFLSLLLCLALVMGVAPHAVAADDSYKSWKQQDSRWSSISIASPDSSKWDMGTYGCYVIAINKILIYAGQQDAASFTPDVCIKALKDTGMLSPNGGIYSGNYNNKFLPTYAPDLKKETSDAHTSNPWSKSTAVKNLSAKIKDGYYVIICVKNKETGNTHWIAVDHVDDDVYVMDNGGVVPLYGTSKYSGGVIDQIYFKYTGSKPYPGYENSGESGTSDTSTLKITTTTEPGEHRKVGSAFYFKGSITSNYNITSATVQVRGGDNATVVMEKTVKPNKKDVDILKDGLDSLKFGTLKEGNYYLWLTAQDSSGETAEWSVPFSVGYPAPPPTEPPVKESETPTTTKTQYRYHRYVTADGRASLCPYYGESTYGAKLTLEYTEWLDKSLTKNSSSSGHNHVYQGSACKNAGCIDPSGRTERYTDGSSNWYYEETRTVTVAEPEPIKVGYKVEHYLERTDAPGSYEELPAEVVVYSGTAGEKVTLYPSNFNGYQMPAEQTVTLPNENSTYCIYYDLASYTLRLSAEPGIASVEGGGVYRFGEQVTLSAQVADGYQWAGWSDGGVQQTGYRFTMPSKDLTLAALATPHNGFVSILPEKFSAVREWSILQFDDLSTKAWYYENVKSAYCYDLMNGRGQNEFAPGGTLTVAESITLAARIHAKYYGKTIQSIDGGAWYDSYVVYAKANGIYAEEPYSLPATRETFARILATALPVEELWDNGNSVSFADRDQIRYLSSVELLCQAGVINGTNRAGATYFDPDDTITRAQAAAIVTRIVIPDLRAHP